MKTVIEMAREAGILEPDDTEQDIVECGVEVWLFGERGMKALERFAELVRADAIADEREACAKAADDQWVRNPNVSGGDAIRSRSSEH